MANRSPPASPNDADDALPLAYVDGELTGAAKAAFEARMAADADLRAEVDGLVAMKQMLGNDAAWAASTQADAPPPHLLDAIVKAEVAARVVRAPAAAPSLTQRMSTWLIGGGVLAGATAVLFVVTRTTNAPQSMDSRTAAAMPAVAKQAQMERTPPAMPRPAAPPAEAPPPPPPVEPEAAAEPSLAMKDSISSLQAGPTGGGFAEAKEGYADEKAAAKKVDADDRGDAAMAGATAPVQSPPPPAAPASAMAEPAPEMDSAPAPKKEAAKAKPPSPRDLARSEALREEEAPADKPRRASKGAVGGSRQNEARTAEAQMAVDVGTRLLGQRRYLEAFDQFVTAERYDTSHALGAAPHWGQAQALVALKRPRDIVATAIRVLPLDVKAANVVDVLVLGSKTAEQQGDIRVARSLYTRLLQIPAQKASARAALARLSAAGEASSQRQQPASADAPAEAPAASTPPR